MLKPELLFIMLLVSTSTALCAFTLLFWKLNRVTRDLVTVRHQVTAHDEPVAAEEPPRFDRDLVMAEMKDILRRQQGPVSMPPRYRYVTSMVTHGLEPDQIAQILEIGKREAEQLVTLARLRHATTDYQECLA